MEWLAAITRMLALVAAGGVLGWYLGSALVGLTAASLLILFFWSHQIWRIERWLQDSTRPPPDVHGIWAELVARVYKQQRVAAETEERLQSTVDYLLDSFAAMRDGVVIVEEGGGIRWCNEAAQTFLGLRYPDDTGRAITNLVREPEFNEYLHAGSYTEPLVFETSGQVRRHLQVIITRFAEGDILLFIRDVTDRVRTEQMRRDFVGNVSHELRTPLTVIMGYLGTMLAGVDQMPAPYQRAMRQMEGQAVRMENLLKDLLWLSRIETTEGQQKHDLVDMTGLLEELREEVANAHPERTLRLQIDCREKIRGDYRELYSAVSNLVYNALKYSPEDGAVTISASCEDGRYCLAVEDEGIGIDAHHIPRLTERFYRVDDSRSSSTGGTGLGLAIVKHVAAAHGAQLNIDSTLGRGSTFKLLFPMAAENTGDMQAC
ncbi:phosphate regulon sensor histidine kinase PhoR [Pseudohalioglobus sediminis]|uniref:Phosphate regulon sensor protein PhoR n=1 Tax=Pseudohalioglobus sediminis TaxID=2606449 RepID=A0A5B0WME2_9GAMM|nr:phosphate regulon sensor histidine kinase PhoR [Pseudohalioglobus sediminis]KAA1188142.1 phosphate regulon sensor histidine kinase PhoR [Pseudohalioglobus sediminis]